MSRDKTNDFRAFFANEYQNLVRHLRSRVSEISDMDLEDIVSDVMLHFFNKPDPAPPIENLAAYIYRSLQHRLTDWARRKNRQVSLDSEIFPGKTMLEELADPRGDEFTDFSRRELREALYAAVNRLEPRQRTVWVATEVEGYSFRELADMWGIPVGTLLARKHRAVAALREDLGSIRNSGSQAPAAHR